VDRPMHKSLHPQHLAERPTAGMTPLVMR
jgi:hypothetical protein